MTSAIVSVDPGTPTDDPNILSFEGDWLPFLDPSEFQPSATTGLAAEGLHCEQHTLGSEKSLKSENFEIGSEDIKIEGRKIRFLYRKLKLFENVNESEFKLLCFSQKSGTFMGYLKSGRKNDDVTPDFFLDAYTYELGEFGMR